MRLDLEFGRGALVLGLALLASQASAQVTTLDATGDVGDHPSVAIGPDGLALISYYDRTNGDLKVAHCSDVSCTGAALHTLDSAGDVGVTSSVTVGGDGLGLIAYQEAAPASAVKLAHCLDALCTSADITTIGNGSNGSVATGADGLGLVAWSSDTGSLMVTHCEDAACSLRTSTAYGPMAGSLPAVEVGPDGLGLVVYPPAVAPGSSGIGALHCQDLACTAATTSLPVFVTDMPPFFFFVTWHHNLAIGGDGRGLFTYQLHVLMPLGEVGALLGPPPQEMVAHCNDLDCSSSVQSQPYGLVNVFQDGSLSRGSDGLGLLAVATSFPSALYLSHCLDAACDSQTLAGPYDPGVDVGATALTLGTDSLPLVAYFAAPADLKVMHCETAGCSPPPPPTISISDAAVVEGDAGTVDASLVVSLSGPSTFSVSVDWQTDASGGGTATPGVDFLVASGSVVFAPGEESRIVTATVFGDTLIEPDETFFVRLSNPTGATIDDDLGLVTIRDDDAPSLSFNELIHGSDQRRDLQAQPGPVADVDYYRLAQQPGSSWEVVVDGASGDVVPVILERLAADNVTVLQSGTAATGGSSVSLRWSNDTAFPVLNQHLSVRSGGCGASCDASAVYRIRAYETTGRIARFNNSATQVTVLILENSAASPALGTLRFRGPGGALLWSQPFSLDPQAEYVLNTSTIPALAGASGSLTVTSDARYGSLQGKAVAVEPATGFTFDTPLESRPR